MAALPIQASQCSVASATNPSATVMANSGIASRAKELRKPTGAAADAPGIAGATGDEAAGTARPIGDAAMTCSCSLKALFQNYASAGDDRSS